MDTEGDIAPQELFQVFRETIIRWLDRARHLTPGEGFELGALVSRLEAELLAEEGVDLVARRMALIGEVQLTLSDVHAPEALIAAAGHLKGRAPVSTTPAKAPVGAFSVVDFPILEATGPKFGVHAAEVPPPASVGQAAAANPAPPPRGERLRVLATGNQPSATPAEPWKRVPLKRLARIVPSARMVVDPIDQPGPSFDSSDFNSKQ